MPTKQVVTKVWIEPGCIVCDACETAAPEVFEVLEDTCIIRPAALETEFTRPRSDNIIEAAEECPVDVIKFDTVEAEVSAEEAAAAEPAAAAASGDPAAAMRVPKKGGPDVPDGPVDPAINALLNAVTARGGREGMATSSTNPMSALNSLGKRRYEELPPDARFAKVLATAREAKADPSEADVGRREFMNKTMLAIGWGGIAATTATSVGAFGRFMMPNVLEEPDSKVNIGPPEKYAAMGPGEVNEDFKLDGVWMIRLEDRIAALSTTCTHLGCIPSWLPNDLKFKCPCHGSGFKQSGVNFEGPAPRPLERLKLTLKDGALIVDKKVKFLEEKGQWTQSESFFLV
jgi:cytochrome b6-f complex iron-sulfur subunit